MIFKKILSLWIFARFFAVQPFFVVWILLMVPMASMSQKSKKKMYHSDLDSLWSKNVYVNGLSNDGKWVAFYEVFDLKDNMFYLFNTIDKKKWKIEKGSYSKFTSDNKWFSCMTSENDLYLFNLKNERCHILRNIQNYTFSTDHDYLIYFQTDGEGKKHLQVRNLKSEQTSSIDNVMEYKIHPRSNYLLYSTKSGDTYTVELYHLDTGSNTLINSVVLSRFHHLIWNTTGNTFGFLETTISQKNALHYFEFNGKGRVLNDTILRDQFPGYSIAEDMMILSADGKNVFFNKTPDSIKSLNMAEKKVEIWNAEDKWIYPRMKEYRTRTLNFQPTLWKPFSDQLIEIGDESNPSVLFNPEHLYAVTYNSLTYEPLYKEYPNADLFVTNLLDGNRKKIIENQYMNGKFIQISPKGTSIAFFRDNDWWHYDMASETTINLTKDLGIEFFDVNFDYAGDVPPYGLAGWSSDGSKIILYDKFDIWAIKSDGSTRNRLTDGRSQQTRYRIDIEFLFDRQQAFSHFYGYEINLDKPLLIANKGSDESSGISLFDKKLLPIVHAPKMHSNLKTNKELHHVIYKQEDYNKSPSLHLFDTKAKTSTLLFQSNKGLSEYDLGKSELIYYPTVDGDSLPGVLIYPPGFDSTKKYPMIVSVYERMGNSLHSFKTPSVYDFTGFNAAKYATDGYFIFYPDIKFTISKPGISAVNCITAAVNKVLSLGNVDVDRLGLIGHSFGGYETLFTITQTNLFSAAVAGAAVTDNVSAYHSVGWNWNQPEIWRFENQQGRMGDSFYKIKDAYFKSSPLHHIEGLNTPLLFWSGKEDLQVHWTQSIAFYLGMKRLNKTGKLLLYSDEGHSIQDPENQKHLYEAIHSWFETYLK